MKTSYDKFIANCTQKTVLRFIDLFAGIGGIRCGLEQAVRDKGMNPVCVMTSEIKQHAVRVLLENHPAETIMGDITKIETKNIPDFDMACIDFQYPADTFQESTFPRAVFPQQSVNFPRIQLQVYMIISQNTFKAFGNAFHLQ